MTTVTASPATTARRHPGLAGETIERLGDRARICGPYDTLGAPVYDDLAQGDGLEVREILHSARRTTGPILDLAAGAGRFTLPLLASGREVTALDLSRDMLGILERRLARAAERIRNRCTVVEADMAGFGLGKSFGCIILGTTSLSLLGTAQRAAMFGSVREHLSPGGEFVLTVLERGDDDGPDEQVNRVMGVSGTEYDLYDHWPAGATHRTITIIPVPQADREDAQPDARSAGPRRGRRCEQTAHQPNDDQPNDDQRGEITVCTDTVGVLDREGVEAEMDRAGLVVREQKALTPAGLRHQVRLLTAVTR